MIEGIGNLLALLVAILGICGGLLNIQLKLAHRHLSFLIWMIGNGTGALLYLGAYLGLIEISIGFIFLLVLNLTYSGIDYIGYRNTAEAR
jgi:hypothetical protein